MSVLPEAEVHVWYRNTTALDVESLKVADAHLSFEERARRDRLRFVDDRREYTAAHDLLRRTLSRYVTLPPADWRFVEDDRGKPSIVGTNGHARALSFNLSHTRGWVACAVAGRAALGVDVDRVDPSRPAVDIADRYFTSAEAGSLRRCSEAMRSERFAELWTLKEAFLKAVGVGLSGLSGSLASVSFAFVNPSCLEPIGLPPDERRRWRFALFEPANDVRLAVAVRAEIAVRVVAREDHGVAGERHGLGGVLVPLRVSR
jgi:4'-phosphopantetheinyl transferase